MKIDPELWPKLSKLLDEWLDLPEGLRAEWLDSLGPAEADALPLLRERAAQENAGEDLLNTLARMSQPDASRAGDDTRFASRTLIEAYHFGFAGTNACRSVVR